MGAEAVCAELVAGAAGAVASDRDQAAGEQLGFLEPIAGRLLTADEARNEAARRRGRGRPKGAANRSTRQLREILLGRGATPQENMLEWALLTVEEFAVRLSCTRADAFPLWLKTQEALAPYVMPKMAPADDQGRAVPAIVLAIGGEAANAAGQQAPWLRSMTIEGEVEEIQALSSPVAAPSKRNGEGEGE